MARISELHYSNTYARNSGVSEFLEVALGPLDDPADFVVSFYEADGSLGFEVALDDPRVTFSIDAENGEYIYVLSADNLPILLTDPNGGGANNYEAYALTDTTTVPNTVVDFYDIGGGTQNITASGGAANGAVSSNIPTPTGPDTTTTSIQFNQPNPGTVTYETVGPGDTGLACFTKGTLINTASGVRKIETLKPGDLVATVEHGFQPLRWIGQRKVDGMGDAAPILLRKGALGAVANLKVSPQHRILLQGWHAELYFGQDEVLVPAKALINDHNILRKPMAKVTYVHLLFDQHLILETHGVASESFLPGNYIMGEGACETEREIAELFPQLVSSQAGFPSAARYLCSVKEANALPQSVLLTL